MNCSKSIAHSQCMGHSIIVTAYFFFNRIWIKTTPFDICHYWSSLKQTDCFNNFFSWLSIFIALKSAKWSGVSIITITMYISSKYEYYKIGEFLCLLSISNKLNVDRLLLHIKKVTWHISFCIECIKASLTPLALKYAFRHCLFHMWDPCIESFFL